MRVLCIIVGVGRHGDVIQTKPWSQGINFQQAPSVFISRFKWAPTHMLGGMWRACGQNDCTSVRISHATSTTHVWVRCACPVRVELGIIVR